MVSINLADASNGVSTNTTNFASIAAGFKEPSIFQYKAGEELDIISRSDATSTEHLEDLIMRQKLMISDMFIVEAVAFFGHCDVQAIVSWLKYYKKKFPKKNIVDELEGVQNRIQYLGKVGLVWRRKYKMPSGDSIFLYSPTVKGFKIYTERLDKNFNYDSKFLFHSTPRVLRTVHVAEVSCILQSRLAKVSQTLLWKMNSYCIKTEKGKFYPIGYIRSETSNGIVNVIIEPAHFNVDERIETPEERIEKMTTRFSNLVTVGDHFRGLYEDVMYVFCVEDQYGVKKLLKLLSENMDSFNGNVYITSERVLKETNYNFGLSFLKPVIDENHNYIITSFNPENEWFN